MKRTYLEGWYNSPDEGVSVFHIEILYHCFKHILENTRESSHKLLKIIEKVIKTGKNKVNIQLHFYIPATKY